MQMPLIGWLVGVSVQDVIGGVDHWIAFGLLTFIGSKMLYDSGKGDGPKTSVLRLSSLLILSVATSIDALMVGLSFAFLQTSILTPILVIGAVTFSLSLIGFIFGCALGQNLGKRIKLLGGVILIAIGIQILLEALL